MGTLRLTPHQFGQLKELAKLVGNIHLSESKIDSIQNRLERRIYEVGLKTFEQYLTALSQFPEQEIPRLISLLTIHTTSFFREKGHFEYLIKHKLPEIEEKLKSGYHYNVWCGACSTGEEVYSLAMVIDNFCKLHNLPSNFSIYGTDIDATSVEKGERGIFPIKYLSSIPEHLSAYYTKKQRDPHPRFFKMIDELKSHLRWGTVNLKEPLSISGKFDLIIFRNVLIYFSDQEIIDAVNRSQALLKDDGDLVIGMSESLLNMPVKVSLHESSIYRKHDPKPKLKVKPTRSHQRGRLPNAVKSDRPLKILVVDDSKTIRSLVSKMLSGSNITIIAEAENGEEALSIIERSYNEIDVILSDIHMPEMDGITLLIKQMETYKIPTVLLSSISKDDGVHILKAFEHGAIDYIQKPNSNEFLKLGTNLIRRLRIAGEASVGEAVEMAPVKARQSNVDANNQLILIGCSTGGPEALFNLLSAIPNNSPPILIVQHMPAVFTKALASRINNAVEIEVKEAYEGDIIVPGHAYIAPGDFHMRLVKTDGQIKVTLGSDERVNQHRPSVDVLFESALPFVKDFDVMTVLLTGMGQDGALKMKRLHDAGAETIVQDEASSVVFGMANRAIELAAVDAVLPLQDIPKEIFKRLRGHLHKEEDDENEQDQQKEPA